MRGETSARLRLYTDTHASALYSCNLTKNIEVSVWVCTREKAERSEVRASSRLAFVAVIVAAERVRVCVCLRSCYVVASVFGCLYMHVGESAHMSRGFRLVSSLKGLTSCPFRAFRVSPGGVLN
jgi:hypothetical protein